MPVLKNANLIRVKETSRMVAQLDRLVRQIIDPEIMLADSATKLNISVIDVAKLTSKVDSVITDIKSKLDEIDFKE